MKLIAQIEISVQVSEDSWRVVRQTKELKESDTVESIINWTATYTGTEKPKMMNRTAGGEIKLLQVD